MKNDKPLSPDTIDFTGLELKEAQLIWDGLMQYPAKSVYTTLKKLEQQLREQEVPIKQS